MLARITFFTLFACGLLWFLWFVAVPNPGGAGRDGRWMLNLIRIGGTLLLVGGWSQFVWAQWRTGRAEFFLCRAGSGEAKPAQNLTIRQGEPLKIRLVVIPRAYSLWARRVELQVIRCHLRETQEVKTPGKSRGRRRQPVDIRVMKVHIVAEGVRCEANGPTEWTMEEDLSSLLSPPGPGSDTLALRARIYSRGPMLETLTTLEVILNEGQRKEESQRRRTGKS